MIMIWKRKVEMLDNLTKYGNVIKGIISGKKKKVEMPGIEPGASHMRSERSTTELHPPTWQNNCSIVVAYPNNTT